MFRLCVVGSGGVGKSSLTVRYLKNEFTEVRQLIIMILFDLFNCNSINYIKQEVFFVKRSKSEKE